MNAGLDDALWVERFRPRSISECLLPTRLSGLFGGIVAKQQIPNLLLWGPAGSGKTTVARILLDACDVDPLCLNGSLDRGIDVIRKQIVPYSVSMPLFGTSKVVFFDEADYLTQETQAALRNLMEQKNGQLTFVFTANYPENLIEPIHSRCMSVSFQFTDTELAEMGKAMVLRCKTILVDNAVSAPSREVAELVDRHFPDMRKTINQLQCEFGYR